MLKLLAKIYVNTIRRMLTLWYRKKVKTSMTYADADNVQKQISDLKINIKTATDIDQELTNFRWVADPIFGLIDWSPDIESFLYDKKADDCDGAAFYTKYLYSLIGINEAHIYSLMSKTPFLTDSHVICLVKTNSKWHLYSNGAKDVRAFDSIDEGIKTYNLTNHNKYYDFYVEINY